jgi:exonuclease III
MKIISWNYHGLENPWIVRDLCQILKEKRPSILFLMETKCKQHKREGIRIKLGFDGLFVMDQVGRSGGLALSWMESEGLEIQNFTRRHINAVIKFPGRNTPWKLTCFYGHPDSSKGQESWALLKHLQSFILEAWLHIGDFNEVGGKL